MRENISSNEKRREREFLLKMTHMRERLLKRLMNERERLFKRQTHERERLLNDKHMRNVF